MNEIANIEDGEDLTGSTGIGILILGVFVVWVWGAICGWLLTWLFLKS